MKKILIYIGAFYLLSSCITSSYVSISCNEQDVEIYINNEYIGRGLVNYSAPKGIEEINISCKENGNEIYNRNFYIKGKKGELIELTIPKDYKYSNNKHIHPKSY